MTMPTSLLRPLLIGGDRRSIAQSNRARALLDKNPRLVSEIAELTYDEDALVAQRALDLLEKLAHDHPDWVERYKRVFIGPQADSERWEIRLQIVRALPLFTWTPDDLVRVNAILIENVRYPQPFVRAWALVSLATFALKDAGLMRIVRRYLTEFERSDSKALQARAKKIRQRLNS
jgi:hypothetical protein